MRNKKGFTLIEVTAVLLLIAIILIIAVPSINNIIKSIKERELETKKEALVSSAEVYAQNNESLFERTSAIKIPVRTLIYYGYSNTDVTDDDKNCNETIGCLINPVSNLSMNDDIITIRKVKSVLQATYGDLYIPNFVYATFYANGATIADVANDYIKISCELDINGSCTLTNVPQISRTGYTVDGWGITSTSKIGNLGNIELSEDSDFYAITHKDVIVTFDPNGGVLSGSNQKICSYYNSESSCSVSAPQVSSTNGSTFAGWYKENGTEASLSSISNSLTVFAHWNAPKTYALVRRTRNYMIGRESDVKAARNATVTRITNGYRIATGKNKFGGVYLPTDIFENGQRYIIKYKLQKVSGNLYKIGGHLTSRAQNSFKINGVDSTLDYIDEGTSNSNVSNNNTIYNVYLDITYKSGANVYIQPNRGRTDDVTVDVTDIDIYQVFEDAGTEKTYGSLFSEVELKSEVFGERQITEWYNNNSLSTKLTLTTTFNNNTATFDDINTSGTNAYVYGRVDKKQSDSGGSATCNIRVRVKNLNATCNSGYSTTSTSWCQCDFIHRVSGCVDHVDNCASAANIACSGRGGVKSYNSGCTISYE